MGILRYNLFRARQLMGFWRLRLSDKTVGKYAELPIYCQRQKCSPGKYTLRVIKCTTQRAVAAIVSGQVTNMSYKKQIRVEQYTKSTTTNDG